MTSYMWRYSAPKIKAYQEKYNKKSNGQPNYQMYIYNKKHVCK